MRRSKDRILTTRTGSLPRPPELTRLYVRGVRSESVRWVWAKPRALTEGARIASERLRMG
jgi:hypothetical protein